MKQMQKEDITSRLQGDEYESKELGFVINGFFKKHEGNDCCMCDDAHAVLLRLAHLLIKS